MEAAPAAQQEEVPAVTGEEDGKAREVQAEVEEVGAVPSEPSITESLPASKLEADTEVGLDTNHLRNMWC